jgi:mannosyltransferase
MTKSSRALYSFGIVLVLLVSAWISLYHLDRESLWYDEGFTAFILYDDMDEPEGLRATARYLLDSAINLFERARNDVHPLLYYVLLDGWTLVMGESVWILRLPSLFFGLLALSATYALGHNLFDRPTGLIATLILGMSQFFIHYNREARMYTLLLTITVLLILATVRWLQQPTLRRALIMGVLMGLLLHAHYIGVFIIIALLIYQVYYFTREHQFIGIQRWLLPYITGFIVFLPWLPFAIEQLTGHPNGPLGPVQYPVEWGTITWLWGIVTDSQGGVFFISFAIGGGLYLLRKRHIQESMVFLIIWFFVTPLGLLIINSTDRAILVPRYILVSLPAFALMCAFGLRHLMTTPSLIGRFKLQTVGSILCLFLLGWIISIQLTNYTFYWGDRSRWEDALEQFIGVRQSDEPVIMNFSSYLLATYYARQYDLKKGISIDVSWNDFVPEQLHDFAERLDSADSIWGIWQSDLPKTWHTMATLADGRTIGYRDSVENMLFYRFDRTATVSTTLLDFSFYADDVGKFLVFQSGIGHRYYADTGSEFCFPIQLEALYDIGDDWQLLTSLTQGFNTSRAESSFGLPAFSEGDIFAETLCLDVPADAPRGPYLLRVALVHDLGFHQPVVESDDDLFWGYFIGVAWVSVDTPSS